MYAVMVAVFRTHQAADAVRVALFQDGFPTDRLAVTSILDEGPAGVEFLLLYNLFFEQWQFPRGSVLKGESERTCALREFGEETGLKVQKLHEDCRTELQYTCAIRDYALERTIVYFLAEVEPGEVRLGNENHGEARWVAPQEAWELLTETSPEQLPALDAALAYWQQK